MFEWIYINISRHKVWWWNATLKNAIERRANTLIWNIFHNVSWIILWGNQSLKSAKYGWDNTECWHWTYQGKRTKSSYTASCVKPHPPPPQPLFPSFAENFIVALLRELNTLIQHKPTEPTHLLLDGIPVSDEVCVCLCECKKRQVNVLHWKHYCI